MTTSYEICMLAMRTPSFSAASIKQVKTRYTALRFAFLRWGRGGGGRKGSLLASYGRV